MRITFVLINAFGAGGTIRTTLTMAAALADRHDVEVVSVMRHRDVPRLPVDPRVRLRVLTDDSPSARRRRARTWGRFGPVLTGVRAGLNRVPSRLAHHDDVRYRYFSVRTDLALWRFVHSLDTDVVVGTRPSLNLILARHAPSRVVAVGQEHMHLSKHGPGLQDSFARLYPRLEALVTLTKGDAEHYRSLLGPRMRVEAVPNAAPDVGGVRAALDEDTKTVVAAGRLARQKGFDRLVNAWAGVTREHPDWRLDIFGEGTARTALQERIDKRRLSGTITLRGFTGRLYEQFAQSSVYVLSSRSEGFPMVLLEAMGCGLPLIAFDCPTGPAEIVHDGVNGLLVPDGDVAALTAALNSLIEQPHVRHAMGAAGVEAAALYAPERIANRWDRLFAELVAAPRRR